MGFTASGSGISAPLVLPPAVAVVIATHRRAHLLSRCLQALLAQDLPAQDFEIVIANDRPDPATRELVTHYRSLAQDPHPQLIYLPLPEGRGPAQARNAGWRATLAPVIAFTDDDTEPQPGWLREGLAALHAPQTTAASGRIIVPVPAAPKDYERDTAGLAHSEFATANCFVRRLALQAVGGFDARFRRAWREDSDLQFALLEHGARIVRAPRACVVHPLRPAPFAVSLRQQRKIQYDALLYKKHRRLYRRRIRRAPRWDYYRIVGALLLGLTLLALRQYTAAALMLSLWLGLSAEFFRQRLSGGSPRAAQLLELALTSLLIPPVAVFWRMVGALRFRVLLL